jgi:hypothetical protein
MLCPSCRKEIPVADKIGFRDECPLCGVDLHACRACSFYDPGSYNDCRETQADRVVDKDKANFCEYFQPGAGAGAAGLSPAEEAKRKLAELFGKKS